MHRALAECSLLSTGGTGFFFNNRKKGGGWVWVGALFLQVENEDGKKEWFFMF